jgi:hypothetical protein
MGNTEFSKQSIRLAEFVKETGYSINAFAKECNIPSTRTMMQILKEGKSPSSKVLNKIIKRFPQLNHDWVVLGYGEMIIKGIQNQPATASSIQKSKAATFETINERQINSDFQLNELTRRVEQSISVQLETTQLIQNQIIKMDTQLEQKVMVWDSTINEMIKDIKQESTAVIESVFKMLKESLEENKKSLNDVLDSKFEIRDKRFDKLVIDHRDLIHKLDLERKANMKKEAKIVEEKLLESIKQLQINLDKNTEKAIKEITSKP